MRRHLCSWFALLLVCSSAHALQSLRIDGRLLAVGDSAARLKELLGEPSARSKAASPNKARARKSTAKPADARAEKKAKANGEQWQYQRGARITTFTIVNGKIAQIQDAAR